MSVCVVCVYPVFVVVIVNFTMFLIVFLNIFFGIFIVFLLLLYTLPFLLIATHAVYSILGEHNVNLYAACVNVRFAEKMFFVWTKYWYRDFGKNDH